MSLLTCLVVNELTNRRSALSSTLLSSDATQEALRRVAPSALESETAPVVFRSDSHTQANRHRVAFSATSFPFKDPSPHSDSPNLLGVRIDICTRDGTFVKPYYVLLKRVGPDKKALRVHRHTIPVFIPLGQLEERYLPVPSGKDDKGENLKPWKRRRQDLRRLVRELRRELVSWHLRTDSAAWLREELGIAERERGNEKDAEAASRVGGDGASLARTLGIVSLDATSIEARYIRIEWSDGRVGRIKLSNRGFVEQAVVMDGDGKDVSTAALFTGGDGRVETLLQRLADSANPG